MRETYKNIPGDMCDFRPYYLQMANILKSGARIIEVGCADGHSAIFMSEMMANLNKKFELVLVESMDYGRDEQKTTLMVNMINSGLADSMRLIPRDSLVASCKFPDQWAHFVFIDASHKYEETKADIRLWWHKVQEGGYLSGHDFYAPEVNQAVNEVIPKDMLEVIETEKGYGVWQVRKHGNIL